jgi:serine/threonine protein phosphatase PrpC
MKPALAIGAASHLGIGEARGGRRKNEDNYLLCQDGLVSWWSPEGTMQRPQPGEGVLLAVCDGLGGHAGGDVASSTAVRVLSKLYQPGAPKNGVRVLVNYLHDAHRQLHRAAAQKGPVTMGTTATVAWVVGPWLYWAHVGDTRLYLRRGDRLFRLSTDQTRNEFARRDGQPPIPNGDHLAQSFIFGSRGLGNDAGLRIDKGIDAGAEALEAGDVLLLSSDGLHGSVPDDALLAHLQTGGSPQQLADELIELALAASTRDNVTAVVVRIDEVPPRSDDWLDDPEETVQF